MPGSLFTCFVSEPLALVGSLTLDFFTWAGQVSRLGGASMVALVRDRPRWRIIISQMYSIGVYSLPIVLVTGLSIGLVLGVQSFWTLHKFNAEVMAGPMTMFSLVTQLCPILTALLVTGRAGSNIAAELGTMKVTEQVDALRVMGTDPVAYLVAPRVLALTLLMPMLGAVSAIVGVYAAGWLLIYGLGVDGGAYWFQTQKFVASWDVLMGLAKCPVLGFAVGAIACHHGLRTKGGASGVGETCTRAVVQGSMVVLVLNFVLTVMSNRLDKMVMT
jgi:phospholipid/cholesterol/gamma-HCH transport system permease protein